MAKGKKRERKRVPKEEHKNLRLWAEGVRETILSLHLEHYQKAMDQGWHYERRYWKKVCREFHGRVDWRTRDNKEPVLHAWDASAPIVEEDLGEEGVTARAARVEVLNTVSHIHHISHRAHSA
jgi:hypothetical protein